MNTNDKKNILINYNEPILEVINLKKQYKRKKQPAINNLNFKVYPGEFHAFVGANGAGKTTTIKSIIGSYSQFSGSVLINGISNKDVESKSYIGYIPEVAHFPARLSSYNYLLYMALLNGLSKIEAEVFVENILKEFKMWNLRDQCPNSFSSGQKKKILLAQSLSNNPRLLIMDEPTANLDPRARIDFFNILKELQKKGTSILVSSHILSELDIYANAVTILDNGKIAFNGKREYEKYNGHKYAYRLSLKNSKEIRKFQEFDKYKIDEENEMIIYSNNSEDLKKQVSFVIKKELAHKVEEYYLSIEDLYKKYVIFGSVDTKNQ